MDIRYISRAAADYPPLLREVVRGPRGIYVRGDMDAFMEGSPNGPPGGAPRHTLAIVGTRRATPEGKHTARAFARELARAGFIIVSGLAFGIDAAAHEGALEAEGGHTVAVLAGGLDDIYPRNNRPLAERILAAGGAIISEHPVGEPPYGYRFIERNRIVSGLCKGVLVVEAPEGSGSLATAEFALEQNRDVFVVPGNIAHPNFKGSHALIRQGAELVTCADEVLMAYGLHDGAREAARRMVDAGNATSQETLILKALQAALLPLDVDKIIEATTLEPRIAHQTISFLLVRGLIKETEGGYTI